MQCGRYRPDFTYELDAQQRVLLLDFDENAHRHYVLRCELVRQVEMAVGFGGRPVTLIRYNPDAIRVDGRQQGVKPAERQQFLLQRMHSALAADGAATFDHFLTVEYLYYYTIPGASRDGHAQTLRFRSAAEYEAWATQWLDAGTTPTSDDDEEAEGMPHAENDDEDVEEEGDGSDEEGDDDDVDDQVDDGPERKRARVACEP